MLKIVFYIKRSSFFKSIRSKYKTQEIILQIANYFFLNNFFSMKIRLNFIKIQIVMNLQVHYLSLKINLMQLKF